MHLVTLHPSDVLFFRDGRPMEGSLAGHSLAWPLPNVINHAFHAALHRAGLAQAAHPHRRGRSGHYETQRDRYFGCLKTAGPFPVHDAAGSQAWYFPRPADAQQSHSTLITHYPVASLAGAPHLDPWFSSSLPDPLEYAVASALPPAKESKAEPWWSKKAFDAYLRGNGQVEKGEFLEDYCLADVESYIGIAIDPETQTTGHGDVKGKIYTAHYLRLREKFRLGVIAEALDKGANGAAPLDLIYQLLNGKPTQILVGGQQRICTAVRSDVNGHLPLPQGMTRGFQLNKANNKSLVKWVLLTPAIWPEIQAGTSKRGTERQYHPGGWLPNWVCPKTGDVLLEYVDEQTRRQRRHLNSEGKGYPSKPPRTARLVAAIIPKPIVVTGWALPNEADRTQGGAKSAHLAVPAGAVYYFEADSKEDAEDLAAALNWHGRGDFARIQNRRSTLLGEQGFGLGVCGTWTFFPNVSECLQK